MEGRVRRMEATWPVGGCGECANPVRLAWPGREAPERCPGCRRAREGSRLVFPSKQGRPWTRHHFRDRVWIPGVDGAASENERLSGPCWSS
jgi:hypothetical protein